MWLIWSSLNVVYDFVEFCFQVSEAVGQLEKLPAELCIESGFSSNLLCSSCDKLPEFGLATLTEECQKCCLEDAGTEKKVCLLRFISWDKKEIQNHLCPKFSWVWSDFRIDGTMGNILVFKFCEWAVLKVSWILSLIKYYGFALVYTNVTSLSNIWRRYMTMFVLI